MDKAQLERDRKKRFADMFQPYLEYYGREDLTSSVWQIYFDDLKHLTDKQIEAALVQHRQKYKSFPQPSHLLDTIKEKDKRDQDRPGIEDHPEYFRHQDALNELICEKSGLPPVRSRLTGDFLINLKEIVDKAFEGEAGAGTAHIMFVRAFRKAIA